MSKTERLSFTTKHQQPFCDMGGEHVAVYAGKCARCGRNVYGLLRAAHIGGEAFSVERNGFSVADINDPDPRGMIGPRHCLSSMIATEYDMEGGDIAFCWDCVNEHGYEGNQACLEIAKSRWADALTIPERVRKAVCS